MKFVHIRLQTNSYLYLLPGNLMYKYIITNRTAEVFKVVFIRMNQP